MKVKHDKSEIGTPVSEEPYIVNGSLADIPDDVARALGKKMVDMGIEFEAKCPNCGTDMEIMNVLLMKPIDHGSYVQKYGDIFCCPDCGFTKDRKIGR